MDRLVFVDSDLWERMVGQRAGIQTRTSDGTVHATVPASWLVTSPPSLIAHIQTPQVIENTGCCRGGTRPKQSLTN
jgi:hypothetical protein